MTRILILSFYYPPDIGPGSLRAKSLVDGLAEIAGDQIQIDILTSMPNRYHTLGVEAPTVEKVGRQISIQRFALPSHQSGMGDQAKAFLAYARAINKSTQGRQWDLVLATSSRLMTAVLAAWVAKQCGARLYLDVRDLFTDTIEDILVKSPLRILMPVFRFLERWSFQSADQINVVSTGFVSHIKRIAPSLTPTVYTNGIDEEFITMNFVSPISNDVPVILYAGNIGEGQGLHHVIPTVASAFEGAVKFKLLGGGSSRKTLEDMVIERHLSNVEILNPVPRHELFAHYHETDILFLHLNNYKAFHKVLPSKIFEYAATGKPILAGVDGYAAKFLREEVPGVEVFKPCNTVAMQASLNRLLAGPKTIDRSDFCSRYLRKEIMRKMGLDIYTLAKAVR